MVTDTSKNLISKGITDNASATALGTSDTNLVTARSVANAGYVKSSGVTSITIKTTSPLSGGSDTATTSTGTYTLSLGTVGVGNGGTGVTSFTANSLIMSGNSTTAALTTRAITNSTTTGALGGKTTWAADTSIPTLNTLAYWDGRYQTTSNSSNLAYCNKGAFGTMAIKTVGNGFSDSSNTISVAYGTAANTAVQGNATLVTLNGTNKTAASVASFYAPTDAGTSGQVLKSNGSGAPGWQAEYHVELISLIS